MVDTGFQRRSADPRSGLATNLSGRPEPIKEQTAATFQEASARVSRLLGDSLILAQQTVEGALADAEERAQALVRQAEDHARIVGDRVRRTLEEAFAAEQRELEAVVSQSNHRLLELLDEALRRFDAHRGNTPDDLFLAEMRLTVADHRRRPSEGHRRSGAGNGRSGNGRH